MAMSKRILIVDDNELIVEVMSYILINSGYEVTSLPDGDRVIEEVANNHPDLLIIDANMPGMDGRDICKILKLNNATKDTPVIICSADINLDASLNGVGAPNDILHKPFDMTALLDKVEHQLAA
jgi:DNA-binding response OmpR family regulator